MRSGARLETSWTLAAHATADLSTVGMKTNCFLLELALHTLAIQPALLLAVAAALPFAAISELSNAPALGHSTIPGPKNQQTRS